MRHFFPRIAAGLLFAAIASGQQLNANKAAPREPAKPSAPTNALSVDSIVSMLQAGLSEDLVAARIRKEDRAFDLSAGELIALKKAGVSDNLLKVMLDPKAETNKQQHIVVAPVALRPGLLPEASGATPSASANQELKGDPDDPMAPHDSGIYLYTKDREGKPHMVPLERASYQGDKSGGYLLSTLTHGVKKAKTKAVLPGPRASVTVTDQEAIFYFYFEDKSAGLGKSFFAISDLSSPNQFALLKLEVTKSSRETTILESGLGGLHMGSDSKAMTPFKSERIRPGLYKVTVKSLQPGEYCFLASPHAGAALASDIFDFSAATQ